MEDSPGSEKKPPHTHGETEINMTPEAFPVRPFSALVLPFVTDSKRLMWAHSNQVDLQMDGAAELEKAFDRFPYLTQDETASLAQRCSLHPDQIRVWFMVQRLRYGISWDHKDILEVQKKFKASWEKEEQPKDREENIQLKEEARESCGKQAEEVREEQRRMMGATEQEKINHDQQMGEEKVKKIEKQEEDKVNMQKKRKRKKVTIKTGKKSRVVEGDNPVDSAGCTRTRLTAKTQDQLAKMKVAFLRCQYPDSEDYDRLASLTGLPRSVLVQWFGDMRYYVKKLKPSWLTEEQHREVLANIRYRQCLNTLAKA